MTDPLTIVAAVCCLMAAVPAYFYARNRPVFRPACRPAQGAVLPAISVLIPARNEAANIEDCIASIVAAGEGVDLEIVALDDGSEDDTAERVERLASMEPRVRLIHGVGLPEGWNGKQHACQRLADAATHEAILWIDADVRLEPGALGRVLAELDRTGADLLSGFPRQVTVTPLERLLLPLIHFVLLGFLSLRAMRASDSPGFAAGCGQLFLTRRGAYQRAGGHAAIRASRHDGLTLPRAYRQEGLKTDLFDATDVARCRMYESAGDVWQGLLKNATEGIATPSLLPPVTAVLLSGQVLPFGLAGLAWGWQASTALGLSLVAIGLAVLPRLDAAWRFRQPIDGALAHPIGIVLFLWVQWSALVRSLIGRPVTWKGRPAATTG